MGDPQQSDRGIPLDPRLRLLKPARMVLDAYAIREAGVAGADDTDAGRMAQRIEDAIGHSVTDVSPTDAWATEVASWERAVNEHLSLVVAAAEEAAARIIAEHGWDYARNKCVCSARGVKWATHPDHVAKLVVAAATREVARG